MSAAVHNHRALPVVGMALTFLRHKIGDKQHAEVAGHLQRKR